MICSAHRYTLWRRLSLHWWRKSAASSLPRKELAKTCVRLLLNERGVQGACESSLRAQGALGTHLVRHLVADGHEVIGFTLRLTESWIRVQVIPYHHDIRETEMARCRVRSAVSSTFLSAHSVHCCDISEQEDSRASPLQARSGDAYRIVQGAGSRICAACRDDEKADDGSRRLKYGKSRSRSGVCGKAAERSGQDIPAGQIKYQQTNSYTSMWSGNRRTWQRHQ